MDPKNISVIGAGLGGLAVSAMLASRGHKVTVFEKNEKPGGKINEYSVGEYRFDTGPSLLTMPFILEELFSQCGSNIKDYLSLKTLDPICRYFYADGTCFDSFQDTDKAVSEIEKIAPRDVDRYQDFINYASDLYDKTRDAFLFNPLYGLNDLGNLNLLDFLGIDAFTTVSERVDSSFTSPYLRQFFKRFTTYNGSSPYQAPATLNVIPHVELSMGGYYIDGGMYRLVEALEKLAIEQGVEFKYGESVTSINLDKGTAKYLQTESGRSFEADIVISNSDAFETYLNLLEPEEVPVRKRKSIEKLEPSCSGFVLLLGVNKEFKDLAHHNIFFSSNYRREFKQIFEDKIMPDDPTIYVANTSISNPDHAPPGSSNLFVLVNAPYLSKNWDWGERQDEYAQFVIDRLEKRGLKGLHSAIEIKNCLTPVEFLERYRSNKGSIYGTSSNSKLAAFLRPRNKSRHIDNLYLVGGSTHPGGGIPLVVLSAFHAVELIDRYEE